MKSSERRKVLFLLRTYNDIDHIVPIMWKATITGWRAYFVFVDVDHSTDYRIRFVTENGAKHLRLSLLEWYHTRFRHLLKLQFFQKLFDRVIAYSAGLYFLIRYRISVVVNEWSGPYGRGRAELLLRPADLLGLPIYGLPHGYHLWVNRLFNQEVRNIYKTFGNTPNFSNRNWYTKYVVLSPEHKKLNVDYGMDPNKLIVLGSARFCAEWSAINQTLLCNESRSPERDLFTVLFFLPHWDYNVHRNSCIELLKKIAELRNVFLEIKAHTRGTGALSKREKKQLLPRLNVASPDEASHSTLLISYSDVVVNFGSSVGFEALRQGKPVINPTYLHDNQTFFDNSGVVFDTNDEGETLRQIVELQSGQASFPSQSSIDKFLCERVDGSCEDQDVLDSYMDLLWDRKLQSLDQSSSADKKIS